MIVLIALAVVLFIGFVLLLAGAVYVADPKRRQW